MHKVLSDVTGTVWKVEAQPNQQVAAGDTLLIIESMKMEIPISAPKAGVVREIYFVEGEIVEDGQIVAVLG